MLTFAGSTGAFMVIYSIKLSTLSLRVKSLGAGIGIIFCCIVSDILVLLNGHSITAQVFIALSPIITIFSVSYGRKLQKKNITNYLEIL